MEAVVVEGDALVLTPNLPTHSIPTGLEIPYGPGNSTEIRKLSTSISNDINNNDNNDNDSTNTST